MKRYYYSLGQTVEGPFAKGVLLQYYLSGKIPSTSQICEEGNSTWEPIAVLTTQAPSPDQAPLPPTPPLYPQQDTGILSRLIPSKNSMALTGYYLGVFGLIPVLGLPLAIAAFILGILGLKAYRRNHAIRGQTHAWVAIILGGLVCTVYLLAFLSALLK